MKKISVIILCFLTFASCSKPSPQTVVAELKSYTGEIVCYGSVEPQSTIEVVADKGELITGLHVEKGDRISKGDKLFVTQGSSGNKEYLADENGVVAEVSLMPGSVSDGKKAAVIIAQTDKINLSVYLSEKDICNVKVGDTAVISGSGLCDNQYSGKVEKIYSTAEQLSTGIFIKAVISLDSTVSGLVIGQSVKAIITVNGDNERVILPATAVGFDNEGYYVYDEGQNRINLESATVCKDGYAVVGVKEGTQIIRSIQEVENVS